MPKKKKLTLAARLAKMTDEERARYVQKKADKEAELECRRQQLLAAFMKKKLKKESTFTKLNLAKINESWLKQLRNEKLQQLQNTIKEYRIEFNRRLQFKNEQITKRLQHFETYTIQIRSNFDRHIESISKMIKTNQNQMDQMHDVFQMDLKNLLFGFKTNQIQIGAKGQNHLVRLDKMIEDQQCKFEKTKVIIDHDNDEKKDDLEGLYQIKLDVLNQNHSNSSTLIWYRIYMELKEYHRKIDRYRYHFIQLENFDKHSENTIEKQSQMITRSQVALDRIKNDLEKVRITKETELNKLQKQRDQLHYSNLKSKQNLRKIRIQMMENLREMCTRSNQTLNDLERILVKGQRLLNLSKMHYENIPKVNEENSTTKYENKFEEFVENLMPLWQRCTMVKGSIIEGKMEKIRLTKENLDLQLMLKHILPSF